MYVSIYTDRKKLRGTKIKTTSLKTCVCVCTKVYMHTETHRIHTLYNLDRPDVFKDNDLQLDSHRQKSGMRQKQRKPI